MSRSMNIENQYFKVPNDIFPLKVKHNEFVVLSYVMRCANNSKAFPSYETIGKNCSVNRRSAIRIVKGLVNSGYIQKIKRRDNNKMVNKTNIYEVVSNLTPPSVIGNTPVVSKVTPIYRTSDKQLNNEELIINSDESESIINFINNSFEKKKFDEYYKNFYYEKPKAIKTFNQSTDYIGHFEDSEEEYEELLELFFDRQEKLKKKPSDVTFNLFVKSIEGL